MTKTDKPIDKMTAAELDTTAREDAFLAGKVMMLLNNFGPMSTGNIAEACELLVINPSLVRVMKEIKKLGIATESAGEWTYSEAGVEAWKQQGRMAIAN